MNTVDRVRAVAADFARDLGQPVTGEQLDVLVDRLVEAIAGSVRLADVRPTGPRPVVAKAPTKVRVQAPPKPPVVVLDRLDLWVLTLLSTGVPNDVVARTTRLPESDVRHRVDRLLRAFRVESVQGVVRAARDRGVLPKPGARSKT